MFVKIKVSLFLFLFVIMPNGHLSADIIIKMKDGREFNVDRHWERDNYVFFEMHEVTVKFEKNKVKEVIYTDDDQVQLNALVLKSKPQKNPGDFDSNGAAVLLADGKTLQTIRTYEQDGMVVCETVDGLKYFKKNEVQQIVKARGFSAAVEGQKSKVQTLAEENLPPRYDVIHDGAKLKFDKTVEKSCDGRWVFASSYITENGSKYIWCPGKNNPKLVYSASGNTVVTRGSSSGRPIDPNSGRHISRPGDKRGYSYPGHRTNR